MSDALKDLQEANRKLRRMLARIEQPSTGPLQIGTDELAGLAKELSIAGRAQPMPNLQHDVLMAAEMTDYRRNLERLSQVLPELQGRLLAERARVERERNHVLAATSWARSQSMFHRR